MILRIALLQYPIVWGDAERNLELACNRIRAVAGKADIALLPEMFTTGFCTNHPELAQTTDGKTITTLRELTRQTGVAVAGSFICKENDDSLRNRGFFISEDTPPIYIDKAHLYAHGGEDKFFTKGNEPTVIEYKGIKMRMLICYDLRFPVWARLNNNRQYDIILVSANWPECRIQYWDTLVKARAIENQCYICAVNPVGDDGNRLHYNGHSVAYDTRLQPLVEFRDNEEGTKIAEFDIDALKHFRHTLPLWRDADDFTIHRLNDN